MDFLNINEMKINEVYFNEEFAKSITKKDFVTLFTPVVLQDVPAAERKKALSEAWELMNGTATKEREQQTAHDEQ